ncbi:MAG: L-aspartate oxidase [Gammaproteobacteria bacterium]|nr:L-aspartate oxidase [Gammaproteobacteria bacterium]MBU6508853.1 L-aspartate oxidase [Gammaproteobacteria bacterium]MDE1983476.1 L-aspartate oxidase [Gammaproteobacteria bacterium]MDE2108160.1 L-aspartate oxidase [Gammaproteobacteria bacterium]MDE2460191.1 L-aspartate oxidase [Gammaproteobacteria bacterium]
MPQAANYDVLILGSGAAGLSLALRLPPNCRVALVSKGPLQEGSTLYAQGGVSAVLDKTDSLQSHVEDTLSAGAGLCDPQTVRYVVEQGPEAIRWLIAQGVKFTRDHEANDASVYHLTREGGHSHRRVVHAGDATGREIETTLEKLARARPNITLLEQHIAVDLITASKLGLPEPRCYGAYLLDRRTQHVRTVGARHVALATGGANKAYLYTTNPDGSSGDGIAMAWRAGCRVVNMEFMQFHPTCLFHPAAKSFLISEAVRGEGGKLLLPDGTPFMHKFDKRAELAPRDIVARAIDHEMKRLGSDHVLLDISHRPQAFIQEHFPTIYARCLEYGYDMAKGPIPVVPAAHYTCGGVLTDLHARTDLPGLYAIGEVACTGLHGANRMASNSLLECIVFGAAAATDIGAGHAAGEPPRKLPKWDESRVTDSDEEVVVSHNWNELRHCMWDYVGIVRTDKRLKRALSRTELLLHEIEEYYGNFRITSDLIELRNLEQVARLIILSAMARKESRGLHYTLDYPEPDNTRTPQNTVLVPPNFAAAKQPVNWKC